MRIIFVIVTLFGGSGVLIYIILWLIVPEAKTSAEKLEMRGEKINLESLKEMAKEKINEVKDNPRARSSFREAVRLPFVILRKILHAIVPIIRKIVGICITLGASITLLGSLFILTVTVFNIHSPYVDFPVFALGHTALIYAVLFAVFFIIFIRSCSSFWRAYV
ncbi:MAG: PspC domain-containing protein [bacterium]